MAKNTGVHLRPGVAVLLVEDDPLFTAALRRRLERLGCSVYTASAVDGALAALAATPCDLVLTDLRLGEESGLALLKAARDRHPKVGAVLMSGDILHAERGQARALGASAVLQKPFTSAELVSALEAALTERE